MEFAGKKVYLVSVFLAVLPFFGIGIFAGDDFLIRFFPDDAFYYIQAAWNFSETGKISFDGNNWTNGFHPLFFLIVSLFTSVIPKHLLLNGLFLLTVFLVFSAILLSLENLGNILNNYQKSLFLLMFSLPIFFSFVWVSHGLEAGLVVWATVFLFWSWVRAERRQFAGRSENLRLGAAITILMLSRLDLVLVLLPFVCFVLGKIAANKRDIGFRQAVSIFILPLGFGLFYLAVNFLSTGHVLPISATVKKLFPVLFSSSWESSTGGSVSGSILAVLPLGGCLIVLFCAVIPRLRRLIPQELLTGLVLLNLGVVVFYIYLRFFSWHFFFWYFAFPLAAFFQSAVVLATSLAGKVGQGIKLSRRWIWIIGIGLVFNVAANSYFLLRIVPDHTSATYHLLQIARAVDRICGPDAVVGTLDSGIIGFYSGGRVLNLDGLANNYDYLENHLMTYRLEEYFREQGVTHLLARGESLGNRKAVKDGNYSKAIWWPDRRISLPRENELYRYAIPGNFSVYLFKLSSEEEKLPFAVEREDGYSTKRNNKD